MAESGVSQAPEGRSTLLQIAIWGSLIVATLIVYGQVVGFDFINLDDPAYVYDNPHVKEGVTPGSIVWAFSSQTVLNWVPVTMLSHIFSAQLFGMESGMHHLVNVLLHLLASALLMIFLQRATRERLASAFVALIFAVHPLHVESAAWVSERKDTLSAVFFFLALYWYVGYAERPSLKRYLLVMVAFGLGLMSKPMLVTLPFVLLLLDVWPLQRLGGVPIAWRVVWEKLPMVLLTLGESAGTYWIQKVAGSVQTLPLTTRVSNALVSYIVYISKLFWPTRLAVFYPYPDTIAAWTVWSSLTILLGVTAAVVAVWRSRPYLAVGWFWYLGMLVPVVGFVQTGYQARADRYMYLPTVGLLVALAWGGLDLGRRWPKTRPLVMAAAGLSVALSTAVAWRQTAYWQNSETLFVHAIEVTQDNWLAHGNLGAHLSMTRERRGEAIEQLESAIRIRPDNPNAHNNLGGCLADAGLCDSAIPHYLIALRETPNDAAMNSNLGSCLLRTGRLAEAVSRFQSALHTDPNLLVARSGLGLALADMPGHETEAVSQLEAALKLNPDQIAAHRSIANVLMRLGRTGEAISHLEAVQRISPDSEVSGKLAEIRSHEK